MKIAYFNSLPPKQEYLEKVITVLDNHSCSTISDIVKKTGLTKTQVGCALEKLIVKEVVFHKQQNEKKIFFLGD